MKYACSHLSYKDKEFFVSKGSMIISDQQFTVNVRSNNDISGRLYDLDIIKHYINNKYLTGLFEYIESHKDKDLIVTILRHTTDKQKNRQFVHGAVVTDNNLNVLYKCDNNHLKSIGIIMEVINIIKWELLKNQSNSGVI